MNTLSLTPFTRLHRGSKFVVKSLFFAGIMLALSQVAQANMVFLSASRIITSSAETNLAADSDTQSSTSLGAFNGSSQSSVSGASAWTTQISSFGSQLISLNQQVSVLADVVGPQTLALAEGRSFFQVTFEVFAATPFHVTGTKNVGAFNTVTLQLSSPGGNVPLPFSANNLDLNVMGVLQPNVYTLTGIVQTSALASEPAPQFDSNSTRLQFNFRTFGVPDGVSVGWYLAMLGPVLIAARRLSVLRR
jgi:hypothetical protein